MPRQVRVVRTCENHPDTEATDEEYPPIKVGAGAPRIFDVCPACEEGIVRPFLELLSKGSTVSSQSTLPSIKPKRRDSGPAECPMCGQTLVDRQGLSGHLRRVHNTSIKTLRAEGVDA